jgi:hypothetical protein
VTFGELLLADQRWVLADLAPHVAILVKRWFRRVDVAAKTVRLSATPESSFELRFFLGRYPMRMGDVARAELERLAGEHEDRQRRVQALAMLGDGYSRAQLPMAKPARDYQDFAAEICHATGSLLCADEAGLGKTVTAIAAMARDGGLPAAVVVPLSVLEQWARKLAEFFPSAAVHVVRSSPEQERKKASKARASADVVLLPYTRLRQWADVLQPRLVVFDEVHHLRHDNSERYLGALEIRTRAALCMGLSATPIYNYGGEFYNIMGVVSPGSLGERAEFYREWCTMADSDGRRQRLVDPEAFGAWLRGEGLMVRRSRRDVGRMLPPMTRVLLDIDIEDEDSASLEALAWRALHGAPRDRFEASGQLDFRLREWTGIAKAPAVADLVAELIDDTGEQVVLFGWHHAVYAIWRDKLARFSPAFYTGNESAKAKDAAAQSFIAGDAKVLIMSLRSAEGLDGLQGCCHRVVHGELDWSPAVHHQAAARVHRDGQAEGTLEYWPVATGGSDPVIIDTLGVKRWQSDGVVDPTGERAKDVQVDPDHVRSMAVAYLRRRGLDPDKPPADLP